MPTDKQRRAAERRRLQRQNQRRYERYRRQRRVTLISSIVGALVVAGLIVFFVVESSSDDSTPAASTAGSTSVAPTSVAPTSTAPTTAAPTSTAPTYPCAWVADPTATVARKVTKPSTTTPPRTGVVTVSIDTTRGALTFRLNRAEAPCAVESFLSLAHQKYFDNTPCHRLTSTGGLYVLQCGDPTGTGRGGPGYGFATEVASTARYTRGVLAMANSGGADTNGSQFFIVYRNSVLPAQYSVFGTVTSGLAVVDKVAAKGSTPAGDGKPKLPISLTKVAAA